MFTYGPSLSTRLDIKGVLIARPSWEIWLLILVWNKLVNSIHVSGEIPHWAGFIWMEARMIIMQLNIKSNGNTT